MNIKIENRWTGASIYEGDYASVYEAVAGAIKANADLRDAKLRDANLRGANLRDANLRGADLRDANLRGANLRGADLRGADLRGANLQCANLRDANLRDANLQCADLQGADLRDADLRGADLQCADLQDANLQGTKNSELSIAKTRILPEGEIVGWKKLRHGVIAKLRIHEQTKRCHAFGRKCRASEAFVENLFKDGNEVSEGFSTFNVNFCYRKGEFVRPLEPFCEDWTNECSSGIHFFITREEAEAY